MWSILWLFYPESSKSVVAGENVTVEDGKYVHEISSVYSAPDNVSEQNLRFIVSNKSGIGIEARFSIKVTGPVNSEISTKAAPAILNITAFRCRIIQPVRLMTAWPWRQWLMMMIFFEICQQVGVIRWK